MSEKIKAIRGSEERAEEVKQWLIEHGAKDFNECKCSDANNLYYVYPNGKVTSIFGSEAFLFDVEELPHWKAEMNGVYWFIDDCGEVVHDYNNNHVDDQLRYEFGNCFRTREEAEKYRDKIIKLLEERG